jgi:hypothetical protein
VSLQVIGGIILSPNNTGAEASPCLRYIASCGLGEPSTIRDIEDVYVLEGQSSL